MATPNDRRLSIGGSDIAAILGVSRWKTPFDVWMEKRSPEPLPEEDKLVFRFGQYVEEFVAQEYTLATGRKVQRYTKTIVHPQYPFITGNVDRLVVPEGKKVAAYRGEIRTDRLLECKSVSPYMAGEWGNGGTDDIPLYYLTQAHWYMMLTGCRWVDVGALFGNNSFKVYPIPTDYFLQEKMLNIAVDFWERCVIGGAPPKIISQEDIDKLYPKALRDEIEADENTLKIFNELVICKSALRAREANENALEMQIKKYMGVYDTLKYKDRTIATWRTNIKGTRVFRTYERMIEDE